ncbi:PaaX family transcriptional regulator [Streptomyces sp. PTM05]|uniref:PaaX family transcriptional regulator n=1 Tax=Streptantibioticus parmotrematis TaxID=2873249 RepID=A0ABS7QR83_9ACTN|nr:PaaX family transcriptional regulator [Streptantibioticus parmotrematis]
MNAQDDAGAGAGGAGAGLAEAAHTPGSLILTYFGGYGRERDGGGGRIAVASLIRLMDAAGAGAPSVRSAVSRLKRRGLLVPEKVAGSAAYALSRDAAELLADGDRRVYGHPEPDDAWVLVVFSVPESERHKRHLLRSRLTRLGFGTAAPGVWIAPAHLYEEARHALDRLGLSPYVDLFRGAHLGFEPTAGAVRRWWDLEGIAAQHRAFLSAYEPLLDAWSRRRDTPPREAFGDYLRVLDSWRHLPYADPGLPPRLLPAHWPGAEASRVFTALHTRLREAGADFVREVHRMG